MCKVTGNLELLLELVPDCINLSMYTAIKYVYSIAIDKAINIT